ncbi:sodium:proton antiporter [Massilia forsythiae]|uniref:Sodium:proton antiporter n=1 Tax=Massilia forsythiae TaxID=2728020 RepID=A0A7Z2ZUF8_9BURK|nr:cation:proton antiporter [Massilia forsythiae]QJE02245.1 sodium:proton antiporter [Massilia forsythiae]
MTDPYVSLAQLAWPLALVLSWMAGEILFRWTGLPRISIYGLAGFAFGNLAKGFAAPTDDNAFLLLANLGFGLILFELGYRINLRWLRANPWIVATSLAESSLTFVAVVLVAQAFRMPALAASLLAALAMASSPAGLVRVFNEQQAGGQVTERALHLSALNCVLAVFAYNAIVGIGVFQTSGNLGHAAAASLLVLGASALLGSVAGMLVPRWLRGMGRAGSSGGDATMTFALAVLLLVAVTHVLHLSPVLAALSFGLVARHRRSALGVAQRNFGALGDLLSVMLFVYAASTLDWQHVWAGLGLGTLLVIVRLTVKVGVCAAFARVSGISVRKGALSGLALAPMGVFAVLLIEQTRRLGVDLFHSLAPLAAIALLLQLAGPLISQRAVIAANETPYDKEA